MAKLGADFWPLRLARELDDAILDIRTNEGDIAVIVFKSEGDARAGARLRRVPRSQQVELAGARNQPVLEARAEARRSDLAQLLSRIIEPGSCFAGTLAEIVFAGDRSDMLIGQLKGGNPAARDHRAEQCEFRRLSDAATASAGCKAASSTSQASLDAAKGKDRSGARRGSGARRLGLVTFASTTSTGTTRSACFLEERASFSPDGLTGLEANLRFGGPETMESKIFARLTAWQNWIFQRPNAVGEEGALRRYGTGQKPVFDTRRV